MPTPDNSDDGMLPPALDQVASACPTSPDQDHNTPIPSKEDTGPAFQPWVIDPDWFDQPPPVSWSRLLWGSEGMANLYEGATLMRSQ
jgi:hypothetical protein